MLVGGQRMRLSGINILKDQERLGTHDPRHGLELVENHASQVDVIGSAYQQDHIEVPAHKSNVVNLRDGSQFFP
jgi:hypothetical protein